MRMTPTITAFERSPDRGRGLARDMRVRWALEEVGQPYEVRLLSFSDSSRRPNSEGRAQARLKAIFSPLQTRCWHRPRQSPAG